MDMMKAGNSALLREGRPTRIEWGAVPLNMNMKLILGGFNVNNHAYDAVSAKRLLDSVPIHRIFAEHMAQCPERHVELSQKKRLLDFTLDSGHIWHDERRPDRVGNTADVNAPDEDRLFF
jgi:hypothetical protein